MRRIMKMMWLVFLCLPLSMYAQEKGLPQGIQWLETANWKELKKKAKQEQKLIFLDLYATWCGPCKKMDKEVYSNESLSAFMNKGFVCAKLQIDSTAADNEEVKRNYSFVHDLLLEQRISSVPAFLFFDTNGNLLHREDGYKSTDQFMEVCKVAGDTARNYAGMLAKYKNGTLQGDNLFKLAQNLKRFKEDSLAFKVAVKYKESFLDKQDPKTLFTPEFALIFNSLTRLYSSKDPLLRYIFLHQKEVGEAVKDAGFAQRTIDSYVWNEILIPALKPEGRLIEQTPDWRGLEEKISQVWDLVIAKKNMIDARAWYYSQTKDYLQQAKYEIEKIEFNGLPGREDVFGQIGVNRMVWTVIFEHCDDAAVIKTGLRYMEYILSIDPKHHSWIDTYANLLYKSGDKQKALEQEKKALALAEADKHSTKENTESYRTTISKIEQGLPTW